MGSLKYFEEMVEGKLMGLHTAYLARVISVNGNTAKIQPLGNVKAYGESAQSQSPLSSVPIVASAMYKLGITEETTSLSDVEVTPLSSGDIVIAVCCERDISSAKNGNNSTPAANSRHSMSNSVIVGVL